LQFRRFWARDSFSLAFLELALWHRSLEKCLGTNSIPAPIRVESKIVAIIHWNDLR